MKNHHVEKLTQFISERIRFHFTFISPKSWHVGIKYLQARLLQDGRNLAILLLTLFTFALAHRLGSLARAYSHAQQASTTQPSTLLRKMVKRTAHASQPSLRDSHKGVAEPLERPPLSSNQSGITRSYHTMSQVLEQFIFPTSSFWPYYYYDRWNIGEWNNYSMTLSKTIVLGHLKNGLVTMRHTHLSYEDVLKRDWGGINWEDDLE
ncbi:hypothetical protein L204_105591 [Cryptococcus depauperatus]